MTTLNDLASLPTPAVIEPLSFETIFIELQSEFQSRYPDYSALLASDPAVKLLEVAAYREVLLRNRINTAAKASLLAFAAGSDLDHLAAFYGVTRLMDETDEALRLRTRQRIIGFANAGGAAHYRYWALSASPEVADVEVDSPEPGRVRISVLAKGEADTVPDTVLDAVRAVVLRADIRGGGACRTHSRHGGRPDLALSRHTDGRLRRHRGTVQGSIGCAVGPGLGSDALLGDRRVAAPRRAQGRVARADDRHSRQRQPGGASDAFESGICGAGSIALPILRWRAHDC